MKFAVTFWCRKNNGNFVFRIYQRHFSFDPVGAGRDLRLRGQTKNITDTFIQPDTQNHPESNSPTPLINDQTNPASD